MKLLGALILALCHFGTVRLDYDCMCCYTVEEKVHGEARADGKPIGYMYEFDCKKIMKYDSSKQFVPIEFEHQLGYVEEGTNMQKEICPGDPPDTDTIFTSTTLSTMVSTTSLTSTKTTTDVPDSASTSSATITSKSTTRPSTTTAKTTTDKPTPMPTTTTTKTTTDKSTTLPTTTTTKTTTAKTTTRPTTTITKSKTSSTTKLSSTEKTFTISTPATPSPSTTVRTTTSTIKHISSTTPPAVSSSPSLTSTSRPPAPVMTTTVSITTAPNVQNEFNTTDSPLGFIGVGYDLYHGNPGGVARTQDGGDPGILLSKRIFQLTVDSMSINSSAREVDIVMSPSCSNMKTTVVVNDGKSYQSELLRHVTFPNSYPRNQKSDAFVYNKEFMGIRHDTEETLSAIFTDITYSCYLDTLRYKNENASSSQFSITRGFARDVCNLDEHFNITQYRTFIDDWGTNVVMATKLGTMKVERFKTKEQTLIERLQALKQSVSVLYHTGQYKGYNSSLTINSTALATLNAPGIFGTLMNTATIGTPSSPVPVDLTLYPITEALDPDYWMPIFRQALFGDICGTLNQSKLANIKTNLDFALKQYSSYLRAKENLQNVQPLKAHAIQVPLTWPHGTYGLMKSTAGCPSGRVAWQEGFRKYDTEDIRAHNTFSQNIQNYMAGSYAADNIVSVFCMKTHVATNVVYERDWPRGTYCILRFGTCPANFGEGYIYWDDDDGVPPFVGNHNDEGGTLPFGSYGKNTKIHYCCRNDAPQSDPIYMPREMPFILMMFGSKCQHVHGMVMHELYVRWDDEDVGNKDSAGGAHPTDYGGSHDHLLHFCYYSLDDISFPVNNVLVG